MIYIIIGSCVLVTVLAILIYIWVKGAYYRSQNDWLVGEFSRCNVVVFGKKGTGKDLLFAHVIAMRKDKHYANMEYNSNTEVITLDEVACGNNDFASVLEDNICKFPPRFENGKDIYISDGGIYLPSQYNSILNKRYKAMPLLYALSRQLYQNNIHVNVQALGRIWDKLREQADSFIRALECYQKGRYMYVKAISYDQYNAAISGLVPSKATITANGEMRKRTFKIKISSLEYDTHYFATKFLELEQEKKYKIKEYLQNVK